jgi:hypothetical protein
MPQELTWPPVINRDTPAWRTLQNLFTQSPPSPEQNRLIVFGSAALQLTTVSRLLSADIDVSLDLVTVGPRGMTTPKAEEHLRRAASKVNAGISKELPYIQVCHWMTFQPANRWERRAFEKAESAWLVVYPHPYDVLFSKLRRSEEKDLEAFRQVIERTGHPTEIEFNQLCIENYRDFEPRLETAPSHLPNVVPSSDLRSNTVRLWQAVWKRPIDIDREIRAVAVQRLEGDWGDYDPALLAELARCAQPPKAKGVPRERKRGRDKPESGSPSR